MALNTNALWKMAYDGLSSEIASKREELNKAEKLLADLLDGCPHTELANKEHYFPGSYNDKAYTERWNQCVCCGKRFNQTYKEHGYYG